MRLAIPLPAGPPSALQRFDPRWKLAGLVLASMAVAALQTLPAMLSALAGALLLAGVAGVRWRWFLARVTTTLAVFALLMIWRPLFPQPGETVDLVLGMPISREGLRATALLLARGAAVVSLMLVLVATAPLHDTLRAAHAFRVPGVLIHVALLSMRYTQLFGEEFSRIRIALRVRGFRNRADVHSFRTIGSVSGTLLVRGHDRGERVAQAMRSRGFDGTLRSMHVHRTAASDVGLFCLIVGTAGGVLLWDGLSR